jgi:hypothetical protein
VLGATITEFDHLHIEKITISSISIQVPEAFKCLRANLFLKLDLV